MPVNITTVDEAIEDNGLKIGVFGDAGSGKTVLCATTKAPTLIINTEGGLLSLKGAPDYIKTARIESMPDMLDLYSDLKLAADNDNREYDWIMIDSASEVAEVILAKERNSPNPDPRAAYGELLVKMIPLIKDFRDLKHYNVCMTFKQTSTTPYGPSLPGRKLDNEIPYLFDEIFALRVELNEEQRVYRVLQTGKDILYAGKDRSGKLNLFEEAKLSIIYDKIVGE